MAVEEGAASAADAASAEEATLLADGAALAAGVIEMIVGEAAVTDMAMEEEVIVLTEVQTVISTAHLMLNHFFYTRCRCCYSRRTLGKEIICKSR